jgi:uncharacterized protein with PIN domain
MKTKYGTLKTRKFKGKCESCNKPITEKQAHIYVDSANHAITNNALFLCAECHNKRYPNDQVKECL